MKRKRLMKANGGFIMTIRCSFCTNDCGIDVQSENLNFNVCQDCAEDLIKELSRELGWMDKEEMMTDSAKL